MTEEWLSVVLNDQPLNATVLVLRTAAGRLLVRDSELRTWRLPMPAAAPVVDTGERYYPLDALPGLRYRVDAARELLYIDAPPKLYARTSIRGVAEMFAPPTASPPGAFLNYDAVVQRTQGEVSTSSVFGVTAFAGGSSLSSTALARSADGSAQAIRLETTWTRDDPTNASSLRVGDAITGTSAWWGGAVRFGGVQWASNFATRPGLITFPLPQLAGEAALPSTLDLYVNGALRLRSDVPIGPFEISNMPAMTGAGDISVVVRDLLGREQILSQSFYVSPVLLRPGLRDFSYELGVARNDFGLASDHYGRPLFTGTERIGLTDDVTAEVHGELLRDEQTLGVAGAWLLHKLAVASAAVAASHTAQGGGGLLVLGLDRAARVVSFGANVQLASARFSRIGLLPGETVPRTLISGYASVALGSAGTAELTGTREDYRNGETVELASLRYNLEIRDAGFLGLALTRTRGIGSDTSIELTFTRTLGERTSASLDTVEDAGKVRALLQAQQNLPAGSGWGYRVAASSDDADREALVSYQNGVGTYALDAGQIAGMSFQQASASGGLTLFDARLFPSRQVEGSFAVVEVGDEAGVRVYSDHQLVGRTGTDGRVLVPNLRPYQDNHISIEQSDLPLDVQIATLDSTAVPYANGGTLVHFSAQHPHGALITLVLESGAPLPAGALVHLLGSEEAFPSALRGEVYVTGLGARNVLRAAWGTQTCEAIVPFEPTREPLPRLGPFVCKEVHP